MSGHADRAIELFNQGYNCSQSVFAAFCDETGMDFETAIKLSSSFGGGMGQLREVCGAVSAMFMVAGLKYGYDDPKDFESKKEHYKRIQFLAQQFKAKNNSIICRELIGIDKAANTSASDMMKMKQQFKRRCEKFVYDAAQMMDEYINNQKIEVVE